MSVSILPALDPVTSLSKTVPDPVTQVIPEYFLSIFLRKWIQYEVHVSFYLCKAHAGTTRRHTTIAGTANISNGSGERHALFGVADDLSADAVTSTEWELRVAEHDVQFCDPVLCLTERVIEECLNIMLYVTG